MTFHSYSDDTRHTTGDEMGQTSNFEEQVELLVLLFKPEVNISDSVSVRPFNVTKIPSDNQYKQKLSVLQLVTFWKEKG